MSEKKWNRLFSEHEVAMRVANGECDDIANGLVYEVQLGTVTSESPGIRISWERIGLGYSEADAQKCLEWSVQNYEPAQTRPIRIIKVLQERVSPAERRRGN